MLGAPGPEKRFEQDLTRIRKGFVQVITTISKAERRDNRRLQQEIRHVANQLRLCRDLARFIDR